MVKRLLVVGGVAGGMSAAARMRRLNEDMEIIVFERGEHVSFSNCCLPYHLSDLIESSESLVLMNPQVLKAQYNLDVRVNNEVVEINRADQSVLVKDLKSGKTYEEKYDALILSPGGRAMRFDIPGAEDIPQFTLRDVGDAAGIHDTIAAQHLKNIVVIGGGFIGIEAAENLKKKGLNVALVELMDQVLSFLDTDMVQIIHKELYDQGVDLHLGTKIEKVENGKALLSNGKAIACDLLVMAAGVKPCSELAEKAGLELTPRKAIKVDRNYRTSDPHIYAIGDAIDVFYRLSGTTGGLALAGPAQKQARAVADFIHGLPTKNTGYLGSACVQVFDFNTAVTGLTCRELDRLGRPDYDYALVIPKDQVGLMPTSQNQFLKVIYELPTGRILGAQAVGKGDVVKRIDVIAGLLKFQPTVEDLKDLELCYAPPFSIARDSVNFAGYVGLNLLNGVYRHVHVGDVRHLVEEKAYIIDVREPDEYEQSHVKTAVNLPLSQLRQRMDEVPKDRPVYLYCRSSQRSYNALMALQNKGWDNLYNIAGSFLGISYHEYYLDQVSGRDSILTGYNFI